LGLQGRRVQFKECSFPGRERAVAGARAAKRRRECSEGAAKAFAEEGGCGTARKERMGEVRVRRRGP
jgi:hypothetical protein